MMEKDSILDKKELIKSYLFDEGLKDEERKIRFEIAWDIWENLEDIMFEIKQELMRELLERLKNSEEFKGYIIVNNSLIEGEQWGSFTIFKPEWKYDKGEHGILNYTLEAGKPRIINLYIGIWKNEDEGIPFKGNWQGTSDINKNLLEIVKKIYETLGGANAGWKVNKWWIVRRDLEKPYYEMPKEFYTQILTPFGRENALDYLFNQFVNLKRATEKLIDEFIEVYKKERA